MPSRELVPSGQLRLSLRTYLRQPEPGVACVESNFHDHEWPVTIPTSQAALVLVDVWDTHIIASHAARTAEITRTRIAPAVAAARQAGVAVVHAPSPVQARRYPQCQRYATAADLEAPLVGTRSPAGKDEWPPAEFRRRRGAYAEFRRPAPPFPDQLREERYRRGIDPSVRPLADDFVVATGDQLHRLCQDREILHLFYVGFAANICIPFKDYAIRAFHARGYNVMLLRDCTTAIEGHDTIETFSGTHQAIRELEMAGVATTTTSAAFVDACASASIPSPT
jgi:nicotinamidase-related amidase